MSEYLLCTFVVLLITIIVWMWIIFIIQISFYVGFALRLCESGSCECGAISYLDLLLNRKDGMLCVCGLFLDVDVFGM